MLMYVKTWQVRPNENALRYVVNDDAPFAELLLSIARRGLTSPLIVRKLPKRWFRRQRYCLIDGLHRLEACKLLKLKQIPVQIITVSETQVLTAQIMASKVRVKTSPEQYAAALRKILTMTEGMTIEELAKRIGKPVEWVQEKLK